MSSMLRTMHGDIGDYQAVRALPPFPLFPWFFVAPGVLLVGVSTWGLLRRRAQRSGKPALVALVVLGLGLVAAPAIFQMWDRAPKGGHMIEDFAPLMTEAKVTKVQGYFLVLADGEAVLRNQMVPAYLSTSTQGSEATALPAIEAFSARWPSISSTMAPMIGAMSDNLGNCTSGQGHAALSPLPLVLRRPRPHRGADGGGRPAAGSTRQAPRRGSKQLSQPTSRTTTTKKRRDR